MPHNRRITVFHPINPIYQWNVFKSKGFEVRIKSKGFEVAIESKGFEGAPAKTEQLLRT